MTVKKEMIAVTKSPVKIEEEEGNMLKYLFLK
jgi:hypothetical protein